METRVQIRPSPVEYIPLFRYFNTFAWLSFLVILLSLVGSFYILLGRLKFKWSRLRSDHHFRLRLILALLLLINRSSCLVEFLSTYYFDSVWIHYVKECENYVKYTLPPPMELQDEWRKRFETAAMMSDISHAFNASSIYCMMAFLLFLTLDRYKRIHMVLPGTWKYYYFKGMVILYSLSLCFICISYGWEYIRNYTVQPIWQYGSNRDPALLEMKKYSFWVELLSILTGMLTYYYYTLRLVLTSVRGVELSLKIVWNALRGRTSLQRDRLTLGGRLMQQASGQDDNLALQEMEIIQMQKIRVAIKMFVYLAAVILIDVAILSMMILVNVFMTGVLDRAGLRHGDVIAFVSSWIVFHVLIIYELLDLFLKQLKKAKIVQEKDTTKGRAQKLDRRLMDDFTQESKEDVVETGLISALITEPPASWSKMDAPTGRSFVSYKIKWPYFKKSKQHDFVATSTKEPVDSTIDIPSTRSSSA